MIEIDGEQRAVRAFAPVPIVLAAAAGSLDGAGLSAFGGVVAGAMTGNLVSLGVGLGDATWSALTPACSALGGYLLGLVTGTAAAGLSARRLPWPGAIGAALALELVALSVFSIVWVLGGPAHTVAAEPVIALAAGAMGIQAATLRRVGKAGTPTNYFTGVVTNWVCGMVDPAGRQWNLGAGARLLSFVLAAAAAVVVHRAAPVLVIAIPVSLVASATVISAVAARSRRPAAVRPTRQLATARAGLPQPGGRAV
ncbi:DUF1275 family protein [Pseudonocardia sp. WMMC193]|uniref:DUF1275 family protein n=1 Tax=Pseudonocardia sp. WMMC193 TaxID=2911965 RepID=UPI001F316E25|nr:YoaK family protein [Pseudonocardia sp. WMMC193]MCF7548615.1 DUF1275 domain-containing protein [Pseudonocardia sp. WMMC193]